MTNGLLSYLQSELLQKQRAAEEAYVRMVLREYAKPAMTGEIPAEAISANGIALVYQPSRGLMWVTQRGTKIGPEYATAINPAL